MLILLSICKTSVVSGFGICARTDVDVYRRKIVTQNDFGSKKFTYGTILEN